MSPNHNRFAINWLLVIAGLMALLAIFGPSLAHAQTNVSGAQVNQAVIINSSTT